MSTSRDRGLEAAAALALEMVADGAAVGLGSGRAASVFIAALAERVNRGLRVRGVPTSGPSALLARQLGIPLVTLDEDTALDLTVDGADEVAPNLHLIKGRGGALVRERVVARASKRQIILVGPEKLVRALGERGPIPVEVIPFAQGPVSRAMRRLGLAPVVRLDPSGLGPILTDNGNLTIDAALAEPLADDRAARALEQVLLEIPGVVDTGLFLGTAERVLVGHPDGRVELHHGAGPSSHGGDVIRS